MDTQSIETLKLLVPAVGGIVSVLLGLNAWFVQRLVRKIDQVEELKGQIALMSQQITELKEDLAQMNEEARSISSLRERIAVLEYALRKTSDDSRGMVKN